MDHQILILHPNYTISTIDTCNLNNFPKNFSRILGKACWKNTPRKNPKFRIVRLPCMKKLH